MPLVANHYNADDPQALVCDAYKKYFLRNLDSVEELVKIEVDKFIKTFQDKLR